jgi:hypothetical protein
MMGFALHLSSALRAAQTKILRPVEALTLSGI